MSSLKKQWIGLGLLTLMLLKAWVIPLIYLDYEIRKEYIAKTLCVNRNRPILNCNGKCFLAKKLAEADKQQQNKAEQDYLSSLIYQVMNVENKFVFQYACSFSFLDAVKYQFSPSLHDRPFIDGIFHPPLV